MARSWPTGPLGSGRLAVVSKGSRAGLVTGRSFSAPKGFTLIDTPCNSSRLFGTVSCNLRGQRCKPRARANRVLG